MDPEAKAQTELKDFTNIFSLDGKVAVVTGGSRGLGLHAASGFVFTRHPTVPPLISQKSHNVADYCKPDAQKSTSPPVKLARAIRLAPP